MEEDAPLVGGTCEKCLLVLKAGLKYLQAERKGYSLILFEWTHSGQIGAQIFYLFSMDGWYGMKVANVESRCNSRCWQLPPLQI